MTNSSAATESRPLAASPGATDREPLTGFHLRVTATTFGANFSDGYALGIIGAVLPVLGTTMHLSGIWQGLLGASALIGLFFGSILLGRVADVIGRQKLYLYNFVLIAVASAAQFWAHTPMLLFLLRLVIGFGLGADYAVGPTLLSEFAPRRLRGFLLGSLTVLWTVGYVVANTVGTYVPLTDTAAHWLLASGALPALLVLLLRIGIPESPSWLATRGRTAEAAQIRRAYLGQSLTAEEEAATAAAGHAPTARYRELFAPGQATKTWFGVIFYSAQVLPYFAIYTFMSQILGALRISDVDTQNLVLNLALLLGGVIGLWPVQRMGRRPFTIGTFAILTLCLGAMAVLSGAGNWLLTALFLIYTFVMSAASNIAQVYPPELFPTALRGSGVGLLNGTSRIASAVGTFVLPVSLNQIGVGWSMGWMALVLLLGTVVSLAWAPETRDTLTTEERHH
ncbi:MFS transporter [Streptomyces sp. NBC_01474]|uniref:MFS transporter n=1 Tax=Streptomyces sp. NBC_01474 TaxID=2903880 RepID=UPI002DD946B3|nr:MFS transporter [Streptomyces sp. NBC_01474]WSD94735.1 MFS transporter [Streptomyces sp. NBC_01474]